MPSMGNKHVVKQPLPSFVANAQQAAAISHTNGPAAFIAAAGTGKTSILVQRLVRLVADEGITPEAILCVTFTRAAAQEMEKRVLKALKALDKVLTLLLEAYLQNRPLRRYKM